MPRSFVRVFTACFSISAYLSTYLRVPYGESNLATALGPDTLVSPSGRPADFSRLPLWIDQVSQGMEDTSMYPHRHTELPSCSS